VVSCGRSTGFERGPRWTRSIPSSLLSAYGAPSAPSCSSPPLACFLLPELLLWDFTGGASRLKSTAWSHGTRWRGSTVRIRVFRGIAHGGGGLAGVVSGGKGSPASWLGWCGLLLIRDRKWSAKMGSKRRNRALTEPSTVVAARHLRPGKAPPPMLPGVSPSLTVRVVCPSPRRTCWTSCSCLYRLEPTRNDLAMAVL
jgi:hypothetical protein